MLGQLTWGGPARQRNQDNLYPVLSRQLHGRDAIGIGCHQCDAVDCFQGGVVRHIQSDSHIYAFLFEVGAKICVCETHGLFAGAFFNL